MATRFYITLMRKKKKKKNIFVVVYNLKKFFLTYNKNSMVIVLSFSSNARLSGLDWSWAMTSSNGTQPSQHPHWLQLQLAAVKLLDFALNLPAERLPQFQM